MKKILLFVILLFGEALCATAEKQKAPPNIVFFLVDDLGWSDVGCYGSSFHETPNIDQLAKEGVRFNQAYAACHVCSPTRASLLTGKYPARLHLTDWLSGRKNYPFQKLKMPTHVQQMPDEEKTLAETFKSHGYSTAIFGKWHLGEEPSGPTSQGFDLQIPRNWNKGWPQSGYHSPFGMDGIEGKDGDYLTDCLTDEALKYIESTKDKPFFLYFSHFAVHDPIQGRKDLVEKYKKKLASMPASKGPAFILEGNPDDLHPLSRKKLDELIKQKSHRAYKVLPQRTVKIKQHQDNVEFAAMVETVDESLGRVLAKLEELGLSDNTIVVFFSDNGGMSGANFGRPTKIVKKSQLDKAFSSSNLPLRGAKGWLYEGGIRVPMIVKWPGNGKKGVACEEPVISTDFYPSLLEMAGLPSMPEQHMDGVSFVSALKGKAFRRNAIYWHFPHYSNHGMQSPGGAIRLGDYKLLEYFENNTVQLFNLKDDLGEQNDLAKKQPKKVRELRDMLHAWRKEVSAQMTTPI
jgi:arylsulfatase A